ncbi:MAG TPA: restriction endonuclease subunit S, partial [Enterococcus sp.]|nr:restriction endonuclease subunit S [Enterococcus sp.]
MSELTKLLEGVKIERKSLGEVSEINRGVRVTKRDLRIEGKYPVVSGGTGFMGYVDEFNREADTITIAQYGSAGYVKWQKDKFWANDVAFSIFPNNNKLNKKYLYHFLLSKQEYLYSISNRTAVPYSISKDKILNVCIPIPSPDNPEKSLKIQQEIVRILDSLSEETNL